MLWESGFFDFRLYTCGWRIGVGNLFMRYQNNSPQYSEFSIGRIKSKNFGLAGGMTYREWRLAKREQNKAKTERRNSNA